MDSYVVWPTVMALAANIVCRGARERDSRKNFVDVHSMVLRSWQGVELAGMGAGAQVNPAMLICALSS